MSRHSQTNHAIEVSDLFDLWVIKIKSLWSFAHVVRRDHVNRARNADHAASMWKVCLFYSQNNKIVWLSNMADTIFYKSQEVCKGMWALFLEWGLAWQANPDHVQMVKGPRGNQFTCISCASQGLTSSVQLANPPWPRPKSSTCDEIKLSESNKTHLITILLLYVCNPNYKPDYKS